MERIAMYYTIGQIKEALNGCTDLIDRIERAFVAYSRGEANIPPVGYLGFTDPKGATHIKYGHMHGSETFTVKIASGFADNSAYGVTNSSGIMIVFSALTGHTAAVLADDGFLTVVRTAVAGAICAKHFAPSKVGAIGIIGTGEQARWQLRWLKGIVDCDRVFVWGRDRAKAETYRTDMAGEGWQVEIAGSPAHVAANCNLIVTATRSTSPLLFAKDIRPGTHITCVGADAPGKNEIDASAFGVADLIVADSIAQCVDHGDTSFAVKSGIIPESRVAELGACIDSGTCRTDDSQISICDLTGVAVQDIAISEAVYGALK